MRKHVASSVLMLEANQVRAEVVEASFAEPPLELNDLQRVLNFRFDDRAVRTGLWDAIATREVEVGVGNLLLPVHEKAA